MSHIASNVGHNSPHRFTSVYGLNWYLHLYRMLGTGTGEFTCGFFHRFPTGIFYIPESMISPNLNTSHNIYFLVYKHYCSVRILYVISNIQTLLVPACQFIYMIPV